MPVTVSFCCVQFWVTRMKNMCDLEGTHELVTREYQVDFELYHSYPCNLNLLGIPSYLTYVVNYNLPAYNC